jgi:ribosomal protein L11
LATFTLDKASFGKNFNIAASEQRKRHILVNLKIQKKNVSKVKFDFEYSDKMTPQVLNILHHILSNWMDHSQDVECFDVAGCNIDLATFPQDKASFGKTFNIAASEHRKMHILVNLEIHKKNVNKVKFDFEYSDNMTTPKVPKILFHILSKWMDHTWIF